MKQSPEKFIIIGQARSGTTAVTSALAQHPDIAMFSELLNDHPDVRVENLRRGLWHEHSNQPRSNPTSTADEVQAYVEQLRSGNKDAEFIRQVLFAGKLCPGAPVTGFKLLYRQAWPDLADTEVIRDLANDVDLKVIHVIRKNLLQVWVSREIAMTTGEWVRFNAEQPAPAGHAPVHCDPAALVYFFELVSRWRQRATACFSGHPTLTINYESDIVWRFETTIDAVQDFLEVPRHTLSAPTIKQARLPLREQLSNFDQIREYFQGSRYSAFFQEG